MSAWEEVANDPWTLRLAVPGGWLYTIVSMSENGQEYRNAVAFVPTPPLDVAALNAAAQLRREE